MRHSSNKLLKKWMPFLSIGMLSFVQFWLGHHIATDHTPHVHEVVQKHVLPLSSSHTDVSSGQELQTEYGAEHRFFGADVHDHPSGIEHHDHGHAKPKNSHHHRHGNHHHSHGNRHHNHGNHHHSHDRGLHSDQSSHQHQSIDDPDRETKPEQSQADLNHDHHADSRSNEDSAQSHSQHHHCHHDKDHDHHHSVEHELAPILIKRIQDFTAPQIAGIVENSLVSLPSLLSAQPLNLSVSFKPHASNKRPSQTRAPPLCTVSNIVL